MSNERKLPSSGREFERGFGWTLLLSAGAHGLILGALVLVPGFALRPLPPLKSYTVDLVDPSKLGGTNLIEGGRGKAPEPPKVEPVKAKPAPPPPQAEPEPPQPEVKPEPPAVEAKPPVPPKAVEPPKPEEDAVALEKKAEPTPTAVQVAKAVAPTPKIEVKPPPTVEQAQPTKPKPTVAKVQTSPTAAPKAVAKTTPSAAPKVAAKATATKAAQAVAKVVTVGPKQGAAAPAAGEAQKGAKTTPAAGDARDEKIAAAIERIKEQAGVRGGGQGTGSGGPGGPISIGPGEGTGGEVRSLATIMYTNRIQAMIKEKWAWAGPKGSLKADIGFNIMPDGAVTNVRTVTSSGDTTYDRQAEIAVRAASPFPSPPAELQQEFADAGFLYTFEPE